jgi:cephalosporin hydroxylase
MDKITIDLKAGVVRVWDDADGRELRLDTPEAFAAVSHAWLRCGWDVKYVYSFTWLGRPIIQLPEDMFRLQEVIYDLKPDVIVETGVAHGGSAVFYAGLCKLVGRGRVVAVDVEVRPHNRKALEEHTLAPLITLIEGDSTAPHVVDRVRSEVAPGDKVLVLLDSNHTKAHVLAELEAYASLVSPGSYAVAMDGIMELIPGAQRTQPDWSWNNPRQAALEFARSHPEFQVVEPPIKFNEGLVKDRVTYWPSAFLLRVG